MKSIDLDIMEFLEHYQQYPCLWNKSSPNYKNRETRDAAERMLMEVSGIEDVRVLRTKIRSIRGTYNNEIRKIKRSTNASGTKKTYKPKLLWFNYADSFLSKNAEGEADSEKKLDVNFQNQGEDSEDINKKKSADVTYGEPLGTSTSSSRPTTASSAEVNPLCKSCRLRNLTTSDSKRCKFETETNSATNSRVGDALREAVVTLRQVANNVSTNEFIIFGQSVGVQLSKLPLHTALKLQFDIQALVTKARLELVTETPLPITQPADSNSPIHSTSSNLCPDLIPSQLETVIPP